MKPDILFFFLFLVLVGCKKSIIEIETVPITDNYIEKIEFPEDYRIQSISKWQNNFLSYNNSTPVIDVYDIEFNLESTYKKSGFGPGEFQKIDSAVIIDNRIIVYDSVKKSFEIFDRDFNNLGSIPTKHKIISLVAHEDGSIYAGSLDMKQYYIVKFEGHLLEKETIILVRDIDEILKGFHSLSIKNDNLFIANIMTNTGIILNLENGKVINIENPFMEKQPEFVYQGEYKLPKQPVWRAGVVTEKHFFQLKNLDSGESIIYRGNFDGDINKSFTFDEHIASIISIDNQFWIFTGTSLKKYPLTKFTN
ncbi:MAG TPA: hypothetical protein DCE78_00950 [Bacteroidetes bacterium]|nr:hypothetical protein [Bacteroidota bacterium]